jgi:hypothetical protein
VKSQTFEFQTQTQDGVIKIPEIFINVIPKNIKVIISPIEATVPTFQPKQQKRKLGFMSAVLPPMPNSFFDPLSKDELEAWGT